MDKKESFYWDLVKGAAIFLMLWGHCIQFCLSGAWSCFEDVVYKVIYTFHMPLFMLVSGYLFSYSFRKRDLRELLEHRIQSMLHPIVMATFVNNVLMQLMYFVLSGHAELLFGRLFGGIGNDLWFLWAVLYCSVITAVCGKVTENMGLQLLLMALGIPVILLLPQWNMTLFMYPYFVAGYFCGMKRDGARKLYRLLRWPMLLIFPILVCFFQTKHYVYNTPMYSEEAGLRASLEIAVFRWVIGFAGSIWMLTLMEGLLHLGQRSPALGTCLRGVSRLGRNSLQLYCLSASLLSGYLPYLYRKFVEVAGGNLFARNVFVYDLLFTPLLAALWSVLLLFAVWCLKKCRLHGLIFGR